MLVLPGLVSYRVAHAAEEIVTRTNSNRRVIGPYASNQGLSPRSLAIGENANARMVPTRSVAPNACTA